MWNRIGCLFLIFLFAATLNVPLNAATSSYESTLIIVPDHFSTIQQAINNASNGDTIFVRAGTYYENIIIDKPLSLVGENRDTTVIDGSHARNVVYIIASNVSVTEFTIRNSGNQSNAGVLLGQMWNYQCANVNISGNEISGNQYGILLALSFNCTISGNIISSNGIGVQDQSRDFDCNIWTMNVDGSNQTLLTTNEMWDDGPEWHPVDNRMLYERFTTPFSTDLDSDIWVMNSDGTNNTRLTFDSKSNMVGGWNPDGSKVVYHSAKSGNGDIWIMDADGTNDKQLTTNPADDAMPTWSPDGNRIIFVSNRTGNQDMWIMNADGSNQTQLTEGIPFVMGGTWSPNGSKIAFHSIENGQNGNWEIWTMNSDGTNVTKLLATPHREAFPHWSPDGNKIAYGSDEMGSWDIWIMNSDGTSRTRITTEWDTEEICSWSPDGSKLAFARASWSLPNLDKISDNVISENEQVGVLLERSSCGATVNSNLIFYNGHGLIANQSNNNYVTNNLIENNTEGVAPGGYVGYGLGIYINMASFNTFSNNSLAGNTFNFCIDAHSSAEYTNYMDDSNTAEGKPIYYWINQENRKVPEDAGSVVLVNSKNILVENLLVDSRCSAGVLTWNMNSSTIRNVTSTNNANGIGLTCSNDNVLTNNTLKDNSVQVGMLVQGSSNNTFRDNIMLNNGLEFGVLPLGPDIQLRYWDNDIDVSNTVNGRKVYYWRNQTNSTIPEDAGVVYLVNCSDIAVRNVEVSRNYLGLTLVNTNNSIVESISIHDCAWGTLLYSSHSNSLSNNNITRGLWWGIGAIILASDNNTLEGNTIAGMTGFPQPPTGPPAGAGIGLAFSNGNKIFRNNFTNNTRQVTMLQPSNSTWDGGYVINGFGNYWSDYVGEDLFWGQNQNLIGEDGIGDTPYVIDANNVDHYPLILPWTNHGTEYDCVFRVFGSSMSPTILAKDMIHVSNTTDQSEIFAAPYPDGDLIVHKKAEDESVYIVRRAIAKWFENGTWFFRVKADGGNQEETVIPFSLVVGRVVSLFRPFDAGYRGRTLTVCVYSNSTLDGFSFDAASKSISFNATGALLRNETEAGYCAVYIPAALLSVVDDVRINNASVSFSSDNYERYTVIIFRTEQNDYTASIHASVIGTLPDVAVANIICQKTIIGEGYTTSINVTIENQGDFQETFNVTLYANDTAVQTLAVTLQYKSVQNVTFTWNTTVFGRSNFTLSAIIEPLQDEIDVADNAKTDGTVRVGIPGDINGDGYVGIDDIFAIASHFSQEPGHPDWNPNLDINGDDYVGIDDIFTAAQHFGQEENP